MTILYRGPSQIDGAPIVVVATSKSRNAKTGDMMQTWILRDDMDPLEAAHSGADFSICGACPHRGTVEGGRNVGRSCYVTLFQAPLNVWRASKRGRYPEASSPEYLAALGAGRFIRLGSYGDPAAVPMHVWDSLLAHAKGWNGYTHQWRGYPELARYCMASADSPTDRAAAKVLGFRVFRVSADLADREPGEVLCPASKEAGFKTDCASCKACGGTSARARTDIVIRAHGSKGKVDLICSRSAA